MSSDRPVQQIGAATPLPLRAIDLRTLPAPARQDQLQRLMAAEIQRPFLLTSELLLRLLVLRVEQQDHVLLPITHHIAFDGSTAIFLREFETLYNAFASGAHPSLPEPHIHYADFALWQRHWLTGPLLEAQLAYWRRQLGPDLTPLQLP